MGDLDDDLGVDLTPLIDVIFMLVIFFIMTMSFTLPVIDFNLPQASTAKAEQSGFSLRISVDAQGTFSVNNQPCAEADIPAHIQEYLVRAKEQEQQLSLELVIDSAAPTQYLITVADLARIYTEGRLLVVSSKPERDLTTPTNPSLEMDIPSPDAMPHGSTHIPTPTNVAPASAAPASTTPASAAPANAAPASTTPASAAPASAAPASTTPASAAPASAAPASTTPASAAPVSKIAPPVSTTAAPIEAATALTNLYSKGESTVTMAVRG